jgi:hypothetical protein
VGGPCRCGSHIKAHTGEARRAGSQGLAATPTLERSPLVSRLRASKFHPAPSVSIAQKPPARDREPAHGPLVQKVDVKIGNFNFAPKKKPKRA